MTTKRRLPGTTGTDISEDRKGDPTKASPSQPDIHVDDDRETLDDAVEEEPWTRNNPNDEDDETP
jgi:hypothetical protein